MPETPSIWWLRDARGALEFFKHNHDLYSYELADEADDIVVIKAVVRSKSKSIVAVSIAREMINERMAGDETLGRFNEEALYMGTLLELELPPGELGPGEIETQGHTRCDLLIGNHRVQSGLTNLESDFDL